MVHRATPNIAASSSQGWPRQARATITALSSGVSRTLFRSEMGVSDELISTFNLRPAANRRAPYLLARRALLDSARCREEGKFESRLLRTTGGPFYKVQNWAKKIAPEVTRERFGVSADI
jgi:hypothetical protein